MSAISGLYDGMVTILDGLFVAPTYRKLVNPFIAELNDTPSLNRGYGFYIGPKTVRAKIGRDEAFEADIIVLQSIVHRGTDRDLSIRETAEKTLLEDQFLLIDYFRLNTSPIEKVWDISYVQDGGLEFVFQSQSQFRIIQTTLKGIYSESC